jgi:hypothetical protein
MSDNLDVARLMAEIGSRSEELTLALNSLKGKQTLGHMLRNLDRVAARQQELADLWAKVKPAVLSQAIGGGEEPA